MSSSINFYVPNAHLGCPIESPLPSPNWNAVAHKVFNCVGQIFKNHSHESCAILIGIDRCLVPAHVVNGTCPEELTLVFNVSAEHNCFVYSFRVLQVIALRRELDFCVIQVSASDQGLFPGHYFSIPAISRTQDCRESLLIHVDDKGHKIGSPSAQCTSTDQYFCSTAQTVPGSSGGGYFDREGALIAMHLARSNGLCRPGFERKGIFIQSIMQEVQGLSQIPVCTPLCPPKAIPQCVALVADQDQCYIQEKHGTLQTRGVLRNALNLVPPQKVFTEIVNFFEWIRTHQKNREDFYSKCWGLSGTIYRGTNFRLDIQVPTKNKSNLQIQVGEHSIAGVLLPRELSFYANNPAKIAEFVNYVMHQWIGAINKAQQVGREVLFEISPKI